jgi:NADPH:quinone reductase-like Zn-dependent oxidoreductase
MMVVGLGPEQAEQHLNGMRKHISDLRICIACINSPKNVTLSGLTKHLDVLKEHLDESSVFVQKLKVTLAYHSPDMTAIAEGYRLAIGNLGPSSHNSDSKFYSTSVMKEVTTEDLCKADYWVNNLLSPVQFAPVLTRMCQSKHETDSKSSARLNALVEIGPHSALRVPIQQTLDTLPKVADIVYYSAQTRDADGNNALLQLLGSLHCHGYPVALDKEGSFGKNTICLTNLPEYSFDHSRSYWHESRLSKNFRFRKYPTSDLLGARVTDWNPLEARWRNIISTLENPWIEDHRINGTLLYPGAGQLVMAIEAVAQYAQDFDERQPAGFRLRDVVFLKPLNISLSPEGVETQISLRPLRDAADRSVGWSEFKICVYEGDEWAETCHGQVIVEYDESENEVSKGREKRDKAAELRKRYLECSSRCTRQVSNEKVYRRLNDYGLELGPTFKVFDDIRYSNERETTSKIKLRQWTLRGNPQHSQPYFIHPTALDGVFQLGIAALANCGNDDVPTMVPSRIGKLWLSAVGLSGENTTSLKGCAKSEYRGYRETHMDILALDQTAESPRVVVDGLETIIIGSKGDKQKPRRRLCYKMVWKPVAMEDVRQNGESNYAEQILLRDKEHIIIVAEQTKLQQDLAIGVKRLLTGQVSSCSILSLEGAARVSTRTPKLYIFLIDLDQFCLSQMDEASFLSLKHIVSSTKFILWVYPYPQYLRSPNAKLSGSIQGLARTLRLEYSELKFILAGLKMDSSAVGVAATIIDVLQRSLSVTDERCETEYLQINGKLTVSRLTTDRELDEIITRRAQGMQHEMRAFGSHAALKLSIETPGLLDTLQFEEDQAVATPLLAHEIEVKPEYCGLNFMDCLVALGRVPQASLGVECAGIVLRAGDDSDLLQGDRVMLCASGTIKSVVRCHYRTAIRIPNNMPLQEAAALPATTATVYQALYNVAHLQAGETILIHAGAGATGQMAIQFAAVLGAVVYVTVGSDEKKQLILDQYQISKDHIFYSRNAEFADGIRRITDGRGVDVVLNSLAGDSLVASWECIAPFGRFVEIGKRDIYAHKQLPMFPFAKNVTFSAVDLAGIWEDCPALMRQILKAVVEMADSKQISVATPLHIYPVSKIEAAFRLLQSGKNIGKVVLEMDKSSQVPMCLKMRTEYELQNNATYIVSGGLGGLGKSAAKWLVTRGARYLLLLSKSGPKTDADSAFIRELEATGAHIAAPSCDITDLAELSNILDRHATDMPPIRGCIQGAMVLRVRFICRCGKSY